MSQVPLPVPQGQLLEVAPSELELRLVLRDIQWYEHARSLVRDIQSADDTQAQMKSLELELSELRDELLLKQTELERQVKTEWQFLVEQMEQKVKEERVLLEQTIQKAREQGDLRRIQAEEDMEALKKQNEDLKVEGMALFKKHEDLKVEEALRKLESLKLKSPLE
ncbi:hypothetical protein N7451_005802 [Penicillium sp. IBT 35674x]|nr:hypothetical protein N7451_005802 [Penicillium sp. IBT 35674x]